MNKLLFCLLSLCVPNSFTRAMEPLEAIYLNSEARPNSLTNNNNAMKAAVDDNPLEAFINAPNEVGETALHYAVEQGNKAVCELLLINRANSNSASLDGQTPLHIAAGCNHKEIYKLLLSLGANEKVRNNDGKTPKECRPICSICLDPAIGNSVMSNQCIHIFHANCIANWLNKSQECPECRTPIIGVHAVQRIANKGQQLTELMQAVHTENLLEVTRLIDQATPKQEAHAEVAKLIDQVTRVAQAEIARSINEVRLQQEAETFIERVKKHPVYAMVLLGTTVACLFGNGDVPVAEFIGI